MCVSCSWPFGLLVAAENMYGSHPRGHVPLFNHACQSPALPRVGVGSQRTRKDMQPILLLSTSDHNVVSRGKNVGDVVVQQHA